jgi:hypothetical protein
MNPLLRMLAAACLAAMPAPAAAAEFPTANSAAEWARFTVELAGELKGEIVAAAAPEQSRRLAAARVLVVNQATRPQSDCRYPTRLAFIPPDEPGAVVICSDNLRALNFMTGQWGMTHTMDRRHYDDGRNSPFYDYIKAFASKLLKQNSMTPDEVDLPCPIEFYLYLRQGGGQADECIEGAESRPAFRQWMEQRNHLLDPKKFAYYRAEAGEGPTDEQVRSAIRTASAETYLTAMLAFATVHEFVHIAYDHPQPGKTGRCAAFRNELEADRVAARIVGARSKMLEIDVARAHMPWLFLGMATREISGSAGSAGMLDAARAKWIVEALRRHAVELRRTNPNDENLAPLEAAVNDPRLKPILAQAEALTNCKGA